MAKADLTAQRLRELLNYDPETGVFTWAVARRGCGLGKVAGCLDKGRNYIVIKLDHTLYRAHRLAVLWMTGEWPAVTVDHIDRQRSNNKWNNLREATRKQNQENLSLDPRNSSGYRGIHWVKEDKVWAASIGHNGKKYALGRSRDIAVAIQLRKDAERRLFTHSSACEPQAENPDARDQLDAIESDALRS